MFVNSPSRPTSPSRRHSLPHKRWKRRDQGFIIVSGRVDADAHQPLGDLLGGDVMDDLPHGLPVGQMRIQPRSKAFGVQSHWHAVMGLLGHTLRGSVRMAQPGLPSGRSDQIPANQSG